MKTIFLALLSIVISAQGAATPSGPPTTAFTRDWLRSTTASNALSKLGVKVVNTNGVAVDMAQYQTVTGMSSNRVIFAIEGDSLSITSSWPAYFSRLVPPDWVVTNYALSSDTCSNMVAEYPSQAGSMMTNGSKGYFSLLAGIGDINFSHSSNSAINSISNVWKQARTSGYRVIAWKLSKRYTGWTEAQTNNYFAVNGWIDANPAMYDYLVDPNLIIRSPTDTSDDIHYNEPAKAAVAALVMQTVFGMNTSGVFLAGGRFTGESLETGTITNKFISAQGPGSGGFQELRVGTGGVGSISPSIYAYDYRLAFVMGLSGLAINNPSYNAYYLDMNTNGALWNLPVMMQTGAVMAASFQRTNSGAGTVTGMAGLDTVTNIVLLSDSNRLSTVWCQPGDATLVSATAKGYVFDNWSIPVITCATGAALACAWPIAPDRVTGSNAVCTMTVMFTNRNIIHSYIFLESISSAEPHRYVGTLPSLLYTNNATGTNVFTFSLTNSVTTNSLVHLGVKFQDTANYRTNNYYILGLKVKFY